MGTTSDVLGVVRRVLADLLVVTVWVAFLTLAALATAWPRSVFYALLVGGIAAWVGITADQKD
ncbi:hypothetical protein [Saliphagus sp. LR7]|uniref:hypothetical protein n=1 Tax=Saliphagus sp. LR7 TaxID=2282654 RepID=UPI000DF7262C|nr:hypothetical protein [Saliphagus sp. LR7]